MRQYEITEDGDLLTPEGQTAPKSHEFGSDNSGRLWEKARKEVEDGDAEILTYVEPEQSPYVEIATLEATRTERRKREARMGITGAQQWLDDLDVEIEALRP